MGRFVHCNVQYFYFYFLMNHCNDFALYWTIKILILILIGDHVFNLESLVFGYKIYDQAYFDLNLLITLILFSIYFKSKTKKSRYI